MKRSIQSSARAAVQASRRPPSFQSATRTPFVCADCRRKSLSRRSNPTLAARRHLSTSPLSHQQAAPAEAPSPSQKESTTPQTHYDFFPTTFPDGPPPNSPFTPNLRALRREFLQLQAKTHPDIVPSEQKRQAEAVSMRINEAYRALQDPLKRAQYLLSLQGVDVEDESAKLGESELLMEVMEAREAVEEVEREEDLVGLREENAGRIEESVGILERAFEVGDVEGAAREAVRLRYWVNIEESIHGWEKGKGGGVVHH